MKINDCRGKRRFIKIEALGQGDVFECDEILYMKVYGAHLESNTIWGAVLSTGLVRCFKEGTLIEPMLAQVGIGAE